MGMGPRGWGGFGPGDWGDWGGGGHGRHGRGRARRMFDAGELRLVLLKLIADQPRHGYDLIRAIEEMTHGVYAPSPGVIYPTLTLLERLTELRPRGDHMAGSAIGRAVKNLMTALSHRVSRDGLDEDLLHEIAAILDEAAQRIDRVK